MWHAAGGNLEERSERGPGQENPEQASAERKENTLRQQLPHDARASRSHCRSNGHFPAAGCRARKQKIGHVYASDEKYQTHRAKQKHQSRAHILHHLLLQPDDVGARSGIVVRILLLEALGDAHHFGAGLLAGNARLQPGHGNDSGVPIAIVRQRGRPGNEGHEYIGGLQKLKAGGKNPYDGVGPGIESDGLADNFFRAAKPPLPEAVGQENYGRAAGTIFLGQKGSAFASLNAKKRKETGSSHACKQEFWIARPCQAEARAARGFHRFERAALVAPIDIVLIRGRNRGKGTFFRHNHQPRGIAESQGPEQNAIHNAENRGVRADAERERQDGNRRETGAFCQKAERVAQILQQSLHGIPRTAVSLGFQTDAAANRFAQIHRKARTVRQFAGFGRFRYFS